MTALLILAVALAGALAGWVVRGEVVTYRRISERYGRI